MPKRRILVDLEDEVLGPFRRIRDAKAAVECGRKIRFVPVEISGCSRAWEVECGRDVIGDACEIPRNRPLWKARKRRK